MTSVVSFRDCFSTNRPVLELYATEFSRLDRYRRGLYIARLTCLGIYTPSRLLSNVVLLVGKGMGNGLSWWVNGSAAAGYWSASMLGCNIA
ncbi:hypothetical protein HD806DRAFT_407290 [Xylariaceae sp. AK1471]|nr:hypothetical protein HD806DRAFT_407290 [Xylariaceae sp. AK1471]